MKCFLHIGTEKTATTSLQRFLDLNRQQLLADDLIYTRSAGRFNSHLLALSAYDSSRRDELSKMLNLPADSDFEPTREEILRQLRAEIAQTKTQRPDANLICSSELFQSRLRSTSELKRLEEHLQFLGVTEVEVIVYLRQPAEIANSLLSTGLRFGQLWSQPPEPDSPHVTTICNHRQTLENYGAVFGNDNLIVRLFDEKEFVNGSIIEDFMTQVGQPLVAQYQLPRKTNQSLSNLGVELLRRINQQIPYRQQHELNPARAGLIDYIERHFSGEKYVMPARLYQSYDDYYADSNEWVRAHYFPNRQSLFERSHVPEQTRVASTERELDRIADFICEVWLR